MTHQNDKSWSRRWAAALSSISMGMVLLAGCGGGGGGETEQPEATGQASDCFDPSIYAVGATFRLDYQVRGLYTGTAARHGQVTGTATFDGVSGLTVVEVESTLTQGNVVADRRMTHNYLSVDGLAVVEQGYVEENLLDPTQDVKTRTYDPARRDARAELGPNESLNISVRATDTLTTSSGTQLSGGTEAQNERITYRGQESVSVPAGTFEACRFEVRPQGAGGPLDAEWIQVGTGVQLKYVSGSGTGSEITFELLPGSRLNGRAL